MKGIIHGILRSLLALGGCYALYFSIKSALYNMHFYQGLYLIRPLVLIQLMLCFVLYMTSNGVREFMGKRIKLRVLYVITAIITLLIIGAATLELNPQTFVKPMLASDIIAYMALLVMLYFIISDFFQLFIRKKEEKFHSDAEFEIGGPEK